MIYEIKLPPYAFPVRTVSGKAEQYRLMKKKDGELVLQGAFQWSDDTGGGIEWLDIRTEIEE